MLSASVQRFGGEMMVTNRRGRPCGPWIIYEAIKKVRESGVVEGLPERFTFHDLRHYLASLLIASGADVKVVQARMRHESASTTLDVYSHLWPDTDDSTRAAVGMVITKRMAADASADALRTERLS